MKNKKYIYIIVALIIVIAVLVILLLTKKGDKKQVECEPFVGGAYTLVFNTNGGSKVDDVNVCIACGPNAYSSLPTTKKDGMVLIGWYYDAKFEKPVTASTTADIVPVEKLDENSCRIGYEDITLYAKWGNKNNKSVKVTFDARGGSHVKDLTIKCDDDNSALINNLPRPTKTGFEFVAWVDKFDNAILDGALITCDGQLNLIADWKKID